jgi:hypothetical protein
MMKFTHRAKMLRKILNRNLSNFARNKSASKNASLLIARLPSWNSKLFPKGRR